MKPILWALALLMGSAHAGNVPAEIQRNLKPYMTKSIRLDGAVLRVVMAKPMVSQDMYQHIVVNAICGSLWTGKTGWGKTQITRAELVNDIGAQGFAMVNLRATCDAIGTAKGDTVKQLVEQNTVPCVVGECRKR